MLFNSLSYLIFFPLVSAAYFILPYKYRRVLLLAASWYFYMSWKPEYLVLIVFTTVVTFFSAKGMDSHRDRRKSLLFLCLAVNFGILFVFKYFNFFSGLFAGISGNGSFFELNVLLPVGISFYTFQTAGYIADVYRKKISSEHDFIYFALYVSFFPQLVAGPIERASSLLPQLKVRTGYDYARISSGIGMMLFGFFKKIVIADRAAVVVNLAFSGSESMPSGNLMLSVMLFGIQIYCDFSGYSDIAVGSARIMGIELMENFRRPYFAAGFREFWQRWHISLSSWFRDYLYIPLGGNRKGRFRTLLNTLLTFTVSGLWHGANVTFIIWGALHGVFLLFEKAASRVRIPKPLHILLVYITVNLAWVLFRAQDMRQAAAIYAGIFSGNFVFDIKLFGLSTYQLILLVISVAFLFAHSLIAESGRKVRLPVSVLYPALAAFILFFGYFTSREFIYFRF